MRLPEPPLLLITDRRQARWPLVELVAHAIAAGCRWISVREKDLSEDDQVALVRALLPIAWRHGARMSLHGDPALAKAASADGVHLSARSDPITARKLLGAPTSSSACRSTPSLKPTRSIPGWSTMRLRDQRSRPQASLAIAPEIGRKGLAEIAAAARVPVLAIGGINAMRAAEVLAAGPAGIAVMGGVMRAVDPRQEMKALLATITGARR